MRLGHAAVCGVTGAWLCMGTLLAGGAVALAAPAEDDSTSPSDQQRDEPTDPISSLQAFLNSLTQQVNDGVTQQVNDAANAVAQAQASNVATGVAVPIANSAIGAVPATAGAAATLLLIGSQINGAQSAAALPAAALPALSVPALPAPPGIPGLF